MGGRPTGHAQNQLQVTACVHTAACVLHPRHACSHWLRATQGMLAMQLSPSPFGVSCCCVLCAVCPPYPNAALPWPLTTRCCAALSCRPMSPGGRAQLELCLGAAEEALRVLGHTCANMDQVTASLPTCTDSFAYRGKICSLLDASATTAPHVGLLLSDAAAVCGRKSDNSADDLKASAQKLQQQLAGVVQQLGVSTGQLQSALLAQPLASTGTLNMQLTQLQKQLASTAALDGCLRAVGTAYASLLGLSHREGAAVARQFLQDAGATGSSAGQPAGGSASAGGAAPAAVASKVLKLGDCAMKRLRNGDIYKVVAVFALAAGLQELHSCSPTCAAGLLMIQIPRGAPALSSEKLHATHTAFWPWPRAQQKQGRLLCCRAATRACARMGRAATASLTGMSLRESSGTTA